MAAHVTSALDDDIELSHQILDQTRELLSHVEELQRTSMRLSIARSSCVHEGSASSASTATSRRTDVDETVDETDNELLDLELAAREIADRTEAMRKARQTGAV